MRSWLISSLTMLRPVPCGRIPRSRAHGRPAGNATSAVFSWFIGSTTSGSVYFARIGTHAGLFGRLPSGASIPSEPATLGLVAPFDPTSLGCARSWNGPARRGTTGDATSGTDLGCRRNQCDSVRSPRLRVWMAMRGIGASRAGCHRNGGLRYPHSVCRHGSDRVSSSRPATRWPRPLPHRSRHRC